MDLISLTIDGQEVQVPAGTSVLDAAEAVGIHIPRLCYDPCLSSVGACRLCVVEIDGIRNLPASCVTTVTPGMVVRTGTPAVMEARKTILELLVANHPMDCMTCEKMGECKLAEYCYQYGVTKGSFIGEEHHYDLEESNPFIVRDLNKCIVCGKCIRACAEWTGKDILDFAYRGFNTKVTPFGDTPYIESDCVFCGNCVSVCPTGALTEKPMRGQGRRWELKKVRTTCPFCGTGCNFDLNVKGRQGGRRDLQPGRPCQRTLPLRQGAVRLGLHTQPQAPHQTADQEERRVRGGHLERGLRSDRHPLPGDQGQIRPGFLCGIEFRQVHQRGELPRPKIHEGGDGHKQRRPLCPYLTRSDRGRSGHFFRQRSDDQPHR